MSALKFAIIILIIPAALASAQSPGAALVRRAPALNGTVEGSVQVMTAESVTLNGGAVVTGDLLVPGTPTVRLNGNPTYGGTLDGTGATTPTTHKVTLNGNARLGHVVRRTDAIALPTVAAPPLPPIPPTQKPSPELKRTFKTLNHNPIEFYGRALDQFGKPVVGAEVSGVVLYNTGTKAGEKKVKTTTDAQGYFRFADLEGQDLGIGITKEGYEYRSRSSSFSYSYFEADHKRHIPDPKNPVIFTLWKKQGAEALVHYDKSWRIPANGTPARINLATGKTGSQEADLIVSVMRTPLHMRHGERGFEWKASVEVIGGGLVRTGEHDYYNLAPADGYEPRFEYVQAAQSLRDAQGGRIKWTWAWAVSENFFIASRNGKNFARIELRIQPNADQETGDDQAAVGVVVWLNPNGSRNLEFDPKKVITPKP